MGQLASETEVMGLITYNGSLYGGTLPTLCCAGTSTPGGGSKWASWT